MAGKSAILSVKILVDAAKAAGEIDQTASKFDKFSDRVGKLAVPAAIAGAAITAFAKTAGEAASRQQQAMGALESVYGSSADKVKNWAQNAVSSAGLSTSAYAEMSSQIGAQLQNLGISQDKAADGTNALIGLGADLAATFGGETSDAVNALGAALRGEADPAERYGLSLGAAAVKARMAADGTSELTGEAYTAAKAQAIMAMAAEQAGGAVGQFAREADTAAGQQQRATAAWENAKAALGESLLPIMTKVAETLASLSEWVKQNTGLVTTFIAVIGGLAGAILAVNLALKVAAAAQAVWSGLQVAGKAITTAFTAVQWALNAAFAANPIGIVILAVAALIAGIILLWNNCEWFRDAVIAVWEKIAAAFETAWNWIKDVAGAVWDWITGKVSAAADAIGNAVGAVVDWITDKWNAFQSFIEGLWNSVKSVAETVWNGIKSVVDGVMNGIRSVIDGAIGFIVGLWDKVKSVGEGAWNAIRTVAEAVVWPFQKVRDAIQWVIDKLRTAWEWVQKVMSKIPFLGSFLGGGFSADIQAYRAPALAGRAFAPTLTPAVIAAARSSAPATVEQTVINITVNGALDPVAVARQINGIQTAQQRRLRGVAL